MTTRIEVDRHAGRIRCRCFGTHIAPRRLPDRDGVARVALVSGAALLLAGDAVRVEVHVGQGIDLEVVEVAGVVAYDMRGGSARWEVSARVADQASLAWHGLPFVIADGADVERTTELSLEGSARVVLRDTYVFGRSGECGGDLLAHTIARLEGRPLLVEDLDLRLGVRGEPGMLGSCRCLDTVTTLGARLGGADVLQLERPGSIARRRTERLHHSELRRVYEDATADLDAAATPDRALRWTAAPSLPGLEASARHGRQ